MTATRLWLLAATSLMLVSGCRQDAAATVTTIPPPADAKRALIDFVRSHPLAFVAKPDPDRLAELPLTSHGDGTYTFGGVVMDLNDGRYWFTLAQEAPAELEYTGRLRVRKGIWVASAPEETHVWRGPTR